MKKIIKKNNAIMLLVVALVITTSGCGLPFAIKIKEVPKNTVQITNYDEDYKDPTWSPNGNKIFYWLMTELGDEIWSMNSDGSSKKKLLKERLLIGQFIWSKENIITYVSIEPSDDIFPTNRINIYDFKSGQKNIIIGNLPLVTGISWDPLHENQLAIGINGEEAGIFLYDVNTGSKTTIIRDGFEPKWSPDGKYIAYDGLDGIYLYDVLTKETKNIYKEKKPGEFIESLTWSPSSKWIAYRGGPSKEANGIYMLSAYTSTEPEQILNFGVNKIDWSPDGDKLLFSSIAAPYRNDLYVMEVPEKYRN